MLEFGLKLSIVGSVDQELLPPTSYTKEGRLWKGKRLASEATNNPASRSISASKPFGDRGMK